MNTRRNLYSHKPKRQKVSQFLLFQISVASLFNFVINYNNKNIARVKRSQQSLTFKYVWSETSLLLVHINKFVDVIIIIIYFAQ